MITDTRPKELVLYLFFKQAKALDLIWFTIYALKNAWSFVELIREGAL